LIFKDPSKELGGAKYLRMMVIYGGGLEHTLEGFGLTHFAHRLGDLARTELENFLS
jgi:hypothetical protein